MRRAVGPTAFVLGVGRPGGLGAVRALGRAGVPVVAMSDAPHAFGLASRYCVARLCPDPVHQADDLARFLVEQGRRLDQPGVLFPTTDSFLHFVSRYRDDLREAFRFNLPRPEVVEAGVDKRKQYELAERLGVPYPTTFYPETIDDVRRLQGQLDYPAYIKPYHSHLWQVRFPTGGKGVKVSTPRELVAAFEAIFASDLRAMVQSIILGPDTNICNLRVYVDVSGSTLAVFTSRKVRQYPPEFGIGAMVESVRDPEVADLGLCFFRGIGGRGFASIEFKRDDRNGELRFVEINLRFPSQIIHAVDCGINFPLIQYRELAGQAPPPQTAFREGIRWVNGARDLRSSWSYFRAGQLSPLSWVRSWAGVRSFAVFAPDDPGPFIKSNLNKLRRVAGLPDALGRRRGAADGGPARYGDAGE
jgi:D-aspartate ligase